MEKQSKSAPASGTQTHVLVFSASGSAASAGRATVRLDFMNTEIVAVIDVPSALPRRSRREVQRWTRKLFAKLDGDPRPMRVVTTSGANVVAMGYEHAGVCGVVFP